MSCASLGDAEYAAPSLDAQRGAGYIPQPCSFNQKGLRIMAVDDFDTSRNRECEECHRKGFDEGDWLFMGWDDEHELYMCPECQSNSVPNDMDLLDRDAQLRNEADDAGQKSLVCIPTKHVWKEEYYGYKCDVCQMFISYGSEPWLPIDE